MVAKIAEETGGTAEYVNTYCLLGESLRTNGQTRPYWFSISTSQRSMKPVNKIWNKSSLTNQLLVDCRKSSKSDCICSRKGQARSSQRIDRKIKMEWILVLKVRLQQFWVHFLSSGWPDTLKAGRCVLYGYVNWNLRIMSETGGGHLTMHGIGPNRS